MPIISGGGGGGGPGLPTGWTQDASNPANVNTNGGDLTVDRVGFAGSTPPARPTLTSGTATPEQIALALETATLMAGT